jgi:hypothetical protein
MAKLKGPYACAKDGRAVRSDTALLFDLHEQINGGEIVGRANELQRCAFGIAHLGRRALLDCTYSCHKIRSTDI